MEKHELKAHGLAEVCEESFRTVKLKYDVPDIESTFSFNEQGEDAASIICGMETGPRETPNYEVSVEEYSPETVRITAKSKDVYPPQQPLGPHSGKKPPEYWREQEGVLTAEFIAERESVELLEQS